MSNKVNLAAVTQDVSFLDSISTNHADPAYCGDRTYSLSPTYAFLTISGSFISLQTTCVCDVGVHNVTLIVSLTSYSGVSSIIKNLVLSITCEVHTLTFLTSPPASTTFQVGIDTQPKDIFFLMTQTPACGNAVTFSLSPAQTFFSLPSPTLQGGNFQINGVTNSNHNTYTQVLTATVDAKIVTVNFEIIIKDPCSTAIFQTIPFSLVDMTMTMPSSLTSTQTFTIKTDVQVANPTIVCPIIATLSPTAAYISLSGNTISVNAALISIPENYGSNVFTLTVNSPNFSATVTQKTYNFNLIVTCAVTSLIITSQASDTTYTLNQGSLQTSAYTVIQAAACNYPFTYTFALTKNSLLIQQPAWLTWNNNTLMLSMVITMPVEVGIYVLTSTVTIPQNAFNSNTVLSKSYSFTLTVLSDCVNTSINKILRDMITKVSQTADSQSLLFSNTKATQYSNSSYCGISTFTFNPTLPSFLQITGNDLILSSTDPNQTGVYNFDITIGLQDYPQIPIRNQSIKVTIQCEVLTITQVPNPIADQYYRILFDSPLIVPFKFTENPLCGLTISYSVQPTVFPFQVVLGYSPDQITISSQSLKDWGSYKIMLDATSLRPATPLLYLGASMRFDFTLEMIDICRKTKFYKQPIPNIEILRQSSEYHITQNLPISEFVCEAKSFYNFDCGKVSKQLYLSKTNQRAPYWMSVSDQRIAINFQSLTSAYNQAIDLFVSLEDYPFINVTSTFNVTLSNAEIKCLGGDSKIYQIKSGPLSFGVQFYNITSVLNIKLTRTQELIVFKNEREIQQPSFLKVNQFLKLFTIDAEQQDDVGSYKIGWRLGYAEYPESQVMCTAPFQITYIPKFIGEAIDVQSLACNFPWSLNLPTYTDLFEQSVKLNVELGETSGFLSYDEEKNIIITHHPNLMKDYVGKHLIKLVLTDKQKIMKDIEIELNVICFDLKGKSVESLNNQIVYDFPPPQPYVKTINNMGRLRVAFTRPIILPTFNRFPEFEKDNMLAQNCTNGGICKQQTRRLSRSLNQAATINSSKLYQALEIVNRGFVQINNAKMPVVNLSIIPGPDSNLTELEFTWNCVNFDQNYMDFILNFTNVKGISIREGKDKLNVTFTGTKYFKNEDGQSFTGLKAETQPFVIPQQVNPAYANQLAQFTTTIGNSSKAALLLNFFINLFLGGALQQIFSTIKKVSLMVHLLVINVNIPANAQMFFSGLLDFVTFNLIDIEEPIRKGLDLQDEKIINQHFYDLGYHSSYAVINFGNLFVVMCIYIVLFIFIGLTQKIQNKRIKKLRKYLVSILMWNQTLSFMSETYMLLAISCLTNFSYFQFKTFGEIFSGIFAQLGTIVLVFFPVLLLIFMHNKRNKMKNKEFRESLSSIYENLSSRGDNATIMEPFIGMVRVLIFTSMLIFLQDFRYFQIFISNFLVVFMIIYVGWYQPYKAEVNYWNQYNEVFVSIMNYHILCFVDFIQDEPTREIMGFSMIAFLCFNLVTNIGSIMFSKIKDIFLIYRLKYCRWNLQKIKKNLREKQIATLKLKQDKQVSPRTQYILNMRRNKSLTFEQVPDDNEAVPILQAQNNSVQELQNQVKLNRSQVAKKQNSLIQIESSSFAVSQEVDSKSLSVINEEFSSEEEEKNPATFFSKMKKAKNAIVNASTVELKTAVSTPQLHQTLVKKGPYEKIKKNLKKKQVKLIKAKFKKMKKVLNKVAVEEPKPILDLAEEGLSPLKNQVQASTWQSNPVTYIGLNRSPNRKREQDKTAPFGFIDRYKPKSSQNQDKKQPLRDAEKQFQKKMGKFNTMDFIEPNELFMQKTNIPNLLERRDYSSKF